MKRVLVRVFRDPFEQLNPVRVWRENQISGNTGNLLFSDAAVRAVSCDDVEVTCWTTEEIDRHVDEIDDRFDHVVIPLANAFRPSYRGRLRRLTSVIRRLDLPVTVLGVGAQSTADLALEPLASVDEDARDFAAAVLDRSGSIGVRGEFTAEYLSGLGITDVEVIGCPSMFVGGEHLPSPREFVDATSGRAISLALTPGAPLDEAWLADVIAQHPRLGYVPQDRVDLEMMIWGETGRGGPRDESWFPATLDHPIFATRSAHLHLDPRTWVAELARADLAIGTRIHGVIAGILAGTPAHLLVHDSRTRELAEYFDIAHTRIDGGRAFPSLEDVATADAGGPVRGHAARWRRFADFLDRQGLPHAWRPDAVPTYDDSLPPPTPPVVVEHGRRAAPSTVLSWVEEYHSEQTMRLERKSLRHRDQVARLRSANRQLRSQASRLRSRQEVQQAQIRRLRADLDELRREQDRGLRDRIAGLLGPRGTDRS